jgi:hypothetical protein
MNNARAFLKDHPIFSHQGEIENSLNLSVLSQPSFNAAAFASSPSRLSDSAGNASYGRRSSMVIRDAELIVAVGSEIRMTSLEAGPATDKSYIVGMVGVVHRAFRSYHYARPCEHQRSALTFIK